MTADLGRTLLLERLVSLRPQEEVIAIAPLERLGNQAPPFALWTELAAEVASLLSPHRFLVQMRDVVLSARPPRLGQPVQCHATRQADGIRVNLRQEGELASALVVLNDAPNTPPTLSSHDGWAIDRRQRLQNAAELYARTADRPTEVPPSRQFVRWAYQAGLGQLAGRLGPRLQHFDAFPASTPVHATPGLVEALEQLTAWQWYALAGEDTEVRRIARADWFRTPRPDEELMALVVCRGSSHNLPLYDGVVCGPDLQVVLQVQGIELTPRVAAARAGPPRAAWNSFIRVLEGLGQTPAE